MNSRQGKFDCVNMWRFAMTAVAGCIAAGALSLEASGQSAGGAPPSPVAPGDLSRPIFDTTAPVYDPVPQSQRTANAIVAEIEGRPVTMVEVGDVIRGLPPAMARLPFESLYPGVVEQLIKQQATVIRAHELGIDDDPVVRRKMKAAADRQLSEEYLRRATAKGITEAMLLQRYDRDIAGRPGPEEVRVRVIMADTEVMASDILTKLSGGADFADVARRESKDGSASSGGDIGFQTRDQMMPELAAVAFAIPPGQATFRPVRAGGRWFVLKVEERRRQATPRYAEVREQLRQNLMLEGVGQVAAEAVKGLTVRRYDLNGQEAEAAPSGSR